MIRAIKQVVIPGFSVNPGSRLKMCDEYECRVYEVVSVQAKNGDNIHSLRLVSGPGEVDPIVAYYNAERERGVSKKVAMAHTCAHFGVDKSTVYRRRSRR